MIIMYTFRSKKFRKRQFDFLIALLIISSFLFKIVNQEKKKFDG